MKAKATAKVANAKASKKSKKKATKEEAPEPIPSYAVRGARIFCTKGSHYRRLDLPKTHGSFLRDKAAMNEDDSVHVENSTEEVFGNIPTFGICLSDDNDEDDVKTSHVEGLIFPLMGVEIDEIDFPLEGSRCIPRIGKWIGAKEDTLVDEKPALTTACTLTCATGGGCIGFIDDGQFAEDDDY